MNNTHNTVINNNNENSDLPDYKQKFLQQMQQLRRQQYRQMNQSPLFLGTTQRQQINYTNRESKPLQNNIINTSQYSSSQWKQHLNQSSYKRNHDDSHYQLNLLINPQVKKKTNNIQLTPISEYSNAMHNKTVFVNPKNTSC